MSEIVLFHHVLGLTPGIIGFADTLREAGHTVHTPDLFYGRTFGTLEDGLAYAKTIGFSELTERGIAMADDIAEEVVYGGFSLGVVPAQTLAQTRPDARGALFFHSCLPVSEFSTTWPSGVPVQIHAMDRDPFFVEDGDIDAAKALVNEADQAELFLYPGGEHVFADSSLPSYDAEATALLLERVLVFLKEVR